MADPKDDPIPMVLDPSFLKPLEATPAQAPSGLPPLPGQAAPRPSPSALPPLPGQAAPAPRPSPSALPPLPGQAVPEPAPAAAPPLVMTPIPVTPTPLVPKPVAATPVVPTPVASKPVASKPVASKPVASKPVASKPVASKPVASTPVAAATPVAPPVAVAPTPVAAAPVAAMPPAETASKSPTGEAGEAKPVGTKGHPSAGLEALDVMRHIPEKFRKHVDGNSPPPVRLMGARAMVPMGPKDMVHVLYAGIFDPEPKIAALARKSFKGLDDRILGGILPDATVAPQVLGYLAKVHVSSTEKMEPLLLNRTTPDWAFAYAAEKSEEQAIVGMVAGNQERTLRCHDIIRGLRKNPKALRSDLDRAIDFLVREGVFLEDVPEFEDSFVRLGKAEMLEVLKKVELPQDVLTPNQKKLAADIGVTPEQFILGGVPEVDMLAKELQAKGKEEEKKVPFNKLTIPQQLKAAMMGTHEQALEALKSNNRMVAVAGIRSPKIKDADVPKIVRAKSMHEDVIRVICNNGDWTKGYAVKLGLVQHPKTPLSLVLRWLPLLRKTDLKSLSKSKQVPSAVQVHAKRLVSSRG